MALPNEYTRVEYIESSGTQYINTGVSPASYLNTLKIVADAQYTTIPSGSSATAFIFGTGYYNSTTTNRRTIFAGKRGSTSTSNFAFLSGAALGTAVSFNGATLDTNRHIFMIDQVNGLYGFDDDTQSFSTTVNSNLTETLKIFCGHASGTSGNPLSAYSSAKLYSFQIYDNDTLIRDFIPVKRDSDSVYGLYDLANDVFYENQGTGSFIGGDEVFEIIANASPSNGGTVTGGGYYTNGTSVTLTATARGRFSFSYWSDGDTNSSRTITVTGDATYTAIFSKNKIVIGNSYHIYGKRRRSHDDAGYLDQPINEAPEYRYEVISADISEDLLQKATSTIVCTKDVNMTEGDIVLLYDEHENLVYIGIINEIDGSTITTNQIQSLFDFDLYAMVDSSFDKSLYPSYTQFQMLRRYLNLIHTYALDSGSYVGDNEKRALFVGLTILYEGDEVPYPYRTEAEVINGEQLLYDMFSQYEIIPYFYVPYKDFYTSPPPHYASRYYLFNASHMQDGNEYIPPYATIDLSDNAELVRNVDVLTTLEDANVLVIYDSTGTTFRQAYAVLKDGTYMTANENDRLLFDELRYLPPKAKFVNSDEALTAVRDKELKLIQYNHKVNFTFDLDNNFYDFGDINLGQNINFYVGDKLYNSILTGWSFHIEHGRELREVNMVCGKVRTNLTSKLNLGKAGKR